MLSPGGTCTVTAVFVPTRAGDRSGAITVSDGTSAGRYQVYVTGKVVASTVGNLAAGQPVTATTSVPGYPGSAVTDGDISTYRGSSPGAFPQAVTVGRVEASLSGGVSLDLGELEALHGVVLSSSCRAG